MLSCCPLPRSRIWLGKWLGLLVFGASGLLVVFAGVGASSVLLGLRARGEAGSTGLDPSFWRCYRVRHPVQASLDALAELEYEKRLDAGLLQSDAPKWQVLRDVREEVRRAEQLLAPNGLRSWEFQLGDTPVRGDSIIVEYCFFAQDRRRLITGDWRVEGIDGPGRTLLPVRVYPYTTNRLEFPASVVPPSGRIRVTFAGYRTPHLIFARGKGVKVLHDDGSIWLNVFRLAAVLLCHLGMVIALGLSFATVLTFPVASFSGLVFYLLGVGTVFFQGVSRELASGSESSFPVFSGFVIRSGLLMTRGLSLPPVLGRFSGGLSIRFSDLSSSWCIGFSVFFLFIVCLGLIWLTRKELDRIH